MLDNQNIVRKIAKLLKENSNYEVSEAFVKKIAIRTGRKTDSKSIDEIMNILRDEDVVIHESKRYKDAVDILPFIIQQKKAHSGVVMPPEMFFLNTPYYINKMKNEKKQIAPEKLTDINKDLFTVTKFLQDRLGTDDGVNITSEAGHLSLRHTILAYIEECYKGKAKGGLDDKDSAVKYFLEICINAKNTILNDNPNIEKDNLRKYKRFLKEQEVQFDFKSYGEPNELKEVSFLFEMPFFAENIIKRIVGKMFSYEDSIEIYNRQIKQLEIEYTPLSDDVIVTCAVCLKGNLFQKIKLGLKCECGEDLFRKCNRAKCGETVPRYFNECPKCGSRESDPIQFENFISSAKSLVENGFIEQAGVYLAAAKTIDPDSSELVNIQNNIDKSKIKINKIFSEIDELIEKRAFFAAERFLASVRKEVSSNALSEIEGRITTAISTSDKLFASSKNTTEDMQKVLSICTDHPGAMECYERIPPRPPRNITVSINDDGVYIAWESSLDGDVNYRILRNRDAPPESISDCDWEEITNKLFFKDMYPPVGDLHYAVFSERGKSVSESFLRKSVSFLPEISNISLRRRKDCVEISYKIPKGADAVRIKRESGGMIDTIYTGNDTKLIDSLATKQCNYLFTALYKDSESNIKSLLFISSAIPDEILPIFEIQQNNITVRWNTKQTEYNVKILEVSDKLFDPSVGELYEENDLKKRTLNLATARCDDQTISFTVKPNQNHTLIVMIGNENGYLCCGIETVYTGVYPKLNKLPDRVDSNGTHYFTFSEPLPNDVVSFSYTIFKDNKLPINENYKRGDIGAESASNIKVQNIDHLYTGLYNILCTFKLKNGTESSSVCSEVHFQQDIDAHVRLKCKGLKLKAEIRIELNRYDYIGYPYLPKLNLSVGNMIYEISEQPVYQNKRTYKIVQDIILSSPVYNLNDINLVPINKEFINDFTFDYFQ